MEPLKRKIMFIISSYEINGVCTVAKNLIDNLNKDKFEIVLFIEKIADRHYPLNENIKVINMNLVPQRGIVKKVKNISGILKSIKDAVDEEMPEVVLSFGNLPNCYTLLALRLFNKNRCRLIITEHSERFYEKSGIKKLTLAVAYRFMIIFLYRLADYIISVSRYISKAIEGFFLIKREKLRVIYNPINISYIKDLSQKVIDDFTFQEDTRYIAVVSRLSREKGIHNLIKAIAPFADKMNVELLVIGKGKQESELRALAAKCNIGNRVKFLGWKDNPFNYLSKSDIFALPSLYEGFPNVVLEAMACKVPVIASKCTQGMEEIIDNYINGILVPPGNAGALSKGIYNLLTDDNLREKIKSNAYENLKKFDVSKIIEQYEEVLLN